MLALSISSLQLFAQSLSYSIFNSLRAGTGKENWGEGGFVGLQNKKYFDYYTDAKVYYNNFNAGFRYEYVNPPEYGIKQNRLARRFVEYSNSGFTARLGNSFSLFERGLTLNLFENRSLAYHTNLDGVKLNYLSNNVKATAVYGKINFVEPSTVFYGEPRLEDYLINAFSLEYKLLNSFSFGGSYVASENQFPALVNPLDKEKSKTFLPELFLRYRNNSLDVLLNYAHKTTLWQNKNHYGSGLYASISYLGEGLGISFEYKDYRFDVVDPITESDGFRTTRMLPFQNPPTVHKEHSFTLLTRYPHTVNFNDEVGFQFDMFYSINEQTSLNVNFSASSRHFVYELDKKSFQFLKKKNKSSWIPSFTDNYSPFNELHLELEHFLERRESLFRFGFNYRSEITYSPFLETNFIQPQKQVTTPIFLQYLFEDNFSIKVSSENQWVLKYPKTNYFYNQLVSLQAGLYKNYNIGGRIEFTTSEDEPNGEKIWLVIEGGFRINTNHIVTIAYGNERGGQVCSNGLCRQVLPFKGLRFSLISNI